MIIECRTTLAETLVSHLLQQHGAAFERPPLPPDDLRVIFALSAPLPPSAHDTLRQYARNTYGLRLLERRRAAAPGGVAGAAMSRPAMPFVTAADIAARYGVGYRTAARWCQRGLFPHMVTGPKAGRDPIYLIPESDLEGFIPPRRGRPTSAEPSRTAAAMRRSRQRRAGQLDPDT